MPVSQFRFNPADWDKELVAGHHQCDMCGRITAGPGKEHPFAPPKYAPHLHHIDETGQGYTIEEAKERGLPYNVSNGRCPNCSAQFYREQMEPVMRRKTMREWKEYQAKLDRETRERDAFDETLERGRQRYNETLERGRQSFEDTVNGGKEQQPQPEPEDDSQ